MAINQEPQTQRLALHHLTLKPELQARELKPSVVNKYLDAMQRGEEFPPITVVWDGKDHYYLVDGHHRLAATQQLVGIDDIAIKMIPGSFADALWHSWGVNRHHGLPRTQKAKRNAIRAALRHPKWSKQSDRAIAKHIGCDHKTVGSMRRLIPGGEFPTPGTSVASDNAPSKKAILSASLLLARVQSDQKSDFEPDELAIVRNGYEAVNRLLGVKALPSEPLKIAKRLNTVKKQNTSTKHRRVK
jgi:ParB-like nuclease domain